MVAVEKPAEADLSLGVGHFTQQRWDKFLRDYTDDTFKDFLQNCLDARQIVEVGYTCPVRANHAYGNCLIAVSCGRPTGGNFVLTDLTDLPHRCAGPGAGPSCGLLPAATR